jgi:hypothetical protein
VTVLAIEHLGLRLASTTGLDDGAPPYRHVFSEAACLLTDLTDLAELAERLAGTAR